MNNNSTRHDNNKVIIAKQEELAQQWRARLLALHDEGHATDAAADATSKDNNADVAKAISGTLDPLDVKDNNATVATRSYTPDPDEYDDMRELCEMGD